MTDIAGTTRDVLSEQINIDGLPLHIIDTAGLRQASDKVEQIGIERASREIAQADRVLLVVDATNAKAEEADVNAALTDYIDSDITLPPVTLIKNKSDLIDEAPSIVSQDELVMITLSASERSGLSLLRQHLKDAVGYKASESGAFMARRRHIDALKRALGHLKTGHEQLVALTAGEILAEELKLCQDCLNEITGEFTSDDLLGKIFSSFCIGK